MRYSYLIVIIMLTMFSRLPQAVTNTILIILSLLQFFHSQQCLYEFYTLAGVFIDNIRQDFWVYFEKNTEVLCLEIKQMIVKATAHLLLVNQHKKHLQNYCSLIYLPVFGTLFVSFNCNVSVIFKL